MIRSERENEDDIADDQIEILTDEAFRSLLGAQEPHDDDDVVFLESEMPEEDSAICPALSCFDLIWP